MSPEWIDPETERRAWERAEEEDAYRLKLADEEAEYQRLLSEEGEREHQRLRENYSEGDVLGFDDGRPGLGVGIDPSNGFFVTMPYTGRLALGILPLLILFIVSLNVRGCVGEERAQQILHEAPPQSAAGVQHGAN